MTPDSLGHGYANKLAFYVEEYHSIDYKQ